ncbi:MAG TPA: glycosyltransferase [Gemmatimonadaceae bacterium]|nr:glycosyltransferase [Gemmatimonadaceae bacterium]
MTPSVTILIPTYNRIRALETVWPSYLGHPDVARIIVIDDGSTDGTAERVKELSTQTRVPVEVLRHATQLGQPAARMSGIAAATTEWVMFGEDDVWLASDYCSTLLREANELGASVIAGRIVTALVPGEFDESCLIDPPSPVRDVFEVFDLDSMDARFSERTPGPVRAPFIHSIALIRRDIFSAVGFDVWYSGNSWREETDFYLAANSAGKKIYFTPSTVCFHLRGPISAVGGQRVNRVWFEYLAWRNTRYLARKHWSYLQREHGLRGTATGWTLRYFVRRQAAQLKRIARTGFRSTYRG